MHCLPLLRDCDRTRVVLPSGYGTGASAFPDLTGASRSGSSLDLRASLFALFVGLIRESTMSDTDSQNASAQDYDDAVEATPTDDSSANSTRSPGEVEGVEGPRDGTTRRPGKSPRVVITHFYDRVPTYSPTSRDALQKTLPPQPASSQAAPVCGSSSQRTLLPQPISSQAPPASGSSSQPSSPRPQASAEGDLIPLSSDDVRNQPCLLTVTELEEVKSLLTGQYPTATRALKNAVVKISAESYEYWIFRSPASITAANLEPPDYSKPEKYVPKRAATAIPPVPISESVNLGMVLERSFAPAPSGPKKTRPKSLGVPSGSVPPAPPPVDSTAVAAGAADLPLTRAPSKRGKEKNIDPEVEEIPPFKRQKRPQTRSSTPVLDALREGDEHTASLLEKIRTIIPTREAIRDLEIDQVGEMIAQNVLWLSHMTNDLFCSAKAAENVVRKEVVPLKESLAAKDKELNEKVQALEGCVAQAEQEVEAAKREAAEMNEKMSNYTNLSGFLCRDKKEAEAFFRAFLHNKVGEDLAWRYGAWAYAKGRQAMQQEVQEVLAESLNEDDLATISGIMPDAVPDPGAMPYDDPVPSSGVSAPGDA
nr:serine/arginine repetitive matrix protein 2-like [Ipomoea batatas]